MKIMSVIRVTAATAVLSLLAVTGAHAVEIAVTADVGTTGVGAHLITPINSSLNVRAGINYFDYSFNTNTNDVQYDAKVKLRTFDALLDWFPMANQFRLTGGIIYNGNKIDAHGVPNANGTFTIDGTTYQASSAGQVDGHADFRRIAPYLGIGYGNPFAGGKGWSFSADAGVMFMGNTSTSLTNSGCTAPAAQCSQLATSVSNENAKLSDKVHGYNLFPVLRIGVSYHF